MREDRTPGSEPSILRASGKVESRKGMSRNRYKSRNHSQFDIRNPSPVSPPWPQSGGCCRNFANSADVARNLLWTIYGLFGETACPKICVNLRNLWMYVTFSSFHIQSSILPIVAVFADKGNH
jgi:hypothetical protein